MPRRSPHELRMEQGGKGTYCRGRGRARRSQPGSWEKAMRQVFDAHGRAPQAIQEPIGPEVQKPHQILDTKRGTSSRVTIGGPGTRAIPSYILAHLDAYTPAAGHRTRMDNPGTLFAGLILREQNTHGAANSYQTVGDYFRPASAGHFALARAEACPRQHVTRYTAYKEGGVAIDDVMTKGVSNIDSIWSRVVTMKSSLEGRLAVREKLLDVTAAIALLASGVELDIAASENEHALPLPRTKLVDTFSLSENEDNRGLVFSSADALSIEFVAVAVTHESPAETNYFAFPIAGRSQSEEVFGALLTSSRNGQADPMQKYVDMTVYHSELPGAQVEHLAASAMFIHLAS